MYLTQNPLKTASFCLYLIFFATPHIGGSSEEAVLAMGRSAINGLEHNSVLN